MDLSEIARTSSEIRISKGFSSPTSIDDTESLLAKLMLLVTEVAEAAEAVRKGDMENLGEEFADIIIRLTDSTYSLGIDIEAEVLKKMEKNRARPWKHGGKRA